jgi:hypothetical protein
MRKKTDKTKTKIQIKSIWGTLLFKHELETIKDALIAAVSQRADLRGANLRGADLRDANLRSADLRGADLRDANLRSADLRSADLQYANLQYADLRGANLRSADLQYADLRDANLQYANLRSANLRSANLRSVIGLYPIVPEEGSFIGFKKLSNGSVAKIMIPEDAERIGGYTGRKCRAQKAVVIEGTGFSQYDSKFEYKPGVILVPDEWDNDPRVECSHGIHFLLTRKEAENY